MAINTQDLLTLIREAEANSNYDIAIKSGTGRGEDLDVTGLTVGEVRALQRKRKKEHGTAVGAYQIIDKTLDYLVTSRGFKNSQLFDEATQDAMAYALLERRGLNDYYDNKISDEQFLENVATEWAGIPTIEDKTVWDGIAGNKSQVPVERVIAALPQRRGKKPDPLRVQLAKNELASSIDYESILPEPKKETRDDMRRSDGSIKSAKGFLGPIENQAGETMTEFTTDLGEEYGGYSADYNIPTLVPGLNAPELALLQKSKGGEPIDMSKPLGRGIVNKARAHAKERIDQGLNPLYQDFEEYSDVDSFTDQRLAEVTVDAQRVPEQLLAKVTVDAQRVPEKLEPKAMPEQLAATSVTSETPQTIFFKPTINTRLNPFSVPPILENLNLDEPIPASKFPSLSELKDVTAESTLNDFSDNQRGRSKEKLVGVLRSFGDGATLRFGGEIEAFVRSQIGSPITPEGTYKSELKEIQRQQDEFEFLNPVGSTIAELTTTAGVTGFIGKRLAQAGVKNLGAKQGFGEGFTYGAGAGDSFEERLIGSGTGALFGYGVGRVIDIATTPSSRGGLRTKDNDLADSSLPSDKQGADLDLEKALDDEIYTEVDNPRYTQKPLREAQTAGELYDGVIGAVRNFYNDKLTGLSDRLGREVSLDVMGRFQRADEAATVLFGKELEQLSKALVPVIKAINQSESAKGILLDYSAGKMFTEQQIFNFNAAMRKMSPAARKLYRKNLQNKSMKMLEQAFENNLSSEQMAVLRQYLEYSLDKNTRLNAKVFGAKFDDNPNAALNLTFLHTRNRAQYQRFKDQGLTDDQIEERLLSDPAFEQRSRGRYSNPEDPKAPSPADYENPIVSDMRRIQRMEQLSQMQQKFGVRIDEAAEVFGRPLTIEEFLDEFAYTLERKGISRDGSQYTRAQIKEHILGQSKTPHPLIQAANSLAYAVTLAGPMSAILNLADIPLVGAKYGGGAVKESMKVVSPFKSIPNVDLKRMGISQQNFGEFVNLLNEQVDNQQGWMSRTAEKMRQGADFLMKGSTFTTLDQLGKKGVMRGVLKSAADDANAGRLADNWGFYFNDSELNLISDQLTKHGMDWRKYTGKGGELVEELMLSGLGQQQLISAAGRPAAWARHPNLRPLWALRGFVIKQQALAMREVVGNLKAGKPEEAVKFLGRYAAYGAGGYAVINEGRQYIFGDGNFSAGGLVRGYGDAWASLLTANTLGLNDYQYGQIKNIGLLPTFALGMAPIAATRPFDILGTAVDVIDQERPPQTLAAELPILKQTARGVRNVSGMFNLPQVEEGAEEFLRQRNN
mgnify:CR=1 FL=1|tara:strand:+ start:1951 stop:5853 length:3903 start_codon:yes stop_codon:yes gene_type:complete